MLWNKVIGAGGAGAGGVVAYNWSSDGKAVIAWVDPFDPAKLRFAAPANSLSDYSVFQYAITTAWADFSANTYVTANAPIIWNGITYNGFVRSAQWAAGNTQYNQRIYKYSAPYFGYHYSDTETNALARNIYTGNKS